MGVRGTEIRRGYTCLHNLLVTLLNTTRLTRPQTGTICQRHKSACRTQVHMSRPTRHFLERKRPLHTEPSGIPSAPRLPDRNSIREHYSLVSRLKPAKAVRKGSAAACRARGRQRATTNCLSRSGRPAAPVTGGLLSLR